MRDEPSGAALLDAARRALAEEVVPGLSGRPRYVALMVANAIGIAAREIAQAEALAATTRDALAGTDGAGDLVGAIRAGRHDADPALYARLTRAVETAAGIWKPEDRSR